MEPVGFSLKPFLIKFSQQGQPDETVFLPRCAVCRNPITNFEEANLAWATRHRTCAAETTIAGAPVSEIENARSWAVHFDCEDTLRKAVGHPYSVRLSSVLRSCQRDEQDV